MLNKIEGNFDAKGQKIAIIITRWNEFIAERLKEGAIDCLKRHNCNENDISLVYCPGSFEIPLTAKTLIDSNKYDGIIALGAVIRGATTHYDLVSNEATKGIATLSLSSGIPISYGILTTENIEQAIERAGTKAGNKGFEAASTLIEMINLIKNIKN